MGKPHEITDKSQQRPWKAIGNAGNIHRTPWEGHTETMEGMHPRKDIQEVKSFAKPPPLVEVVLSAVCLLLGAKETWDDAKKQMNDPSSVCPLNHAFGGDRTPATYMDFHGFLLDLHVVLCFPMNFQWFPMISMISMISHDASMMFYDSLSPHDLLG